MSTFLIILLSVFWVTCGLANCVIFLLRSGGFGIQSPGRLFLGFISGPFGTWYNIFEFLVMTIKALFPKGTT